MSTNSRRTQPYLGPASTRTITILTTGTTTVVLTNGYQAMTIYNVGSGNLWVGDANVAVGSGQQIVTGAPKSWDNLQDGWSTILIAGSNSTVVNIAEYRV